jgi:F0F1-type ATP synthase assembly protein I
VNDLLAKRQLNKGFADAMSRSFDFAATIGIFCGLGWLIDRVVGTAPAFLVILTIVGFVGSLLRAWYAYDATMRKLEAELPNRNKPATVDVVEGAE